MPKEKAIIMSCEPTLEERERFFMDAEPEPVLPVARNNEALLQQVIDTLTECATEKNRETIRAWFVETRVLLNDLVKNALTTSDKLIGQMRLEVLEQVECGIISALNRNQKKE